MTQALGAPPPHSVVVLPLHTHEHLGLETTLIPPPAVHALTPQVEQHQLSRMCAHLPFHKSKYFAGQHIAFTQNCTNHHCYLQAQFCNRKAYTCVAPVQPWFGLIASFHLLQTMHCEHTCSRPSPVYRHHAVDSLQTWLGKFVRFC